MASRKTMSGPVPRAIAFAALAVSVLAACTPADGAEVYDQGRVVDEMASHVDEGTAHAYTATYQLTGGVNVTVVHSPSPYRDAYIFPDGRYVSTPEFQMICDAATCTLTDPLPTNAPLDTKAIAEAGGPGFISVQDVLSLLTKAALDKAAELTPGDDTLVAEHANCASVDGLTGAASTKFRTCVTEKGVLGRFTGSFNDAPVDLLLVGYGETADENVFTPPSGSKLVDQRDK